MSDHQFRLLEPLKPGAIHYLAWDEQLDFIETKDGFVPVAVRLNLS